MTLSSVVRMLRLRWRTFVSVVVVCAIVGFVVALIVPNRYLSSVQLLVTAKGSSTAQSYQNMEIENARATSYLALLRSEVVDQRVVDDVDLPYSAQTLSDRINAAIVPKTTIIDVQVAGDTADQARDVADSLAKQFVAYTTAIEEPTGSDDQRVQTTIVGTATDPVRERPGPWVFGLLGALIGVVLGVAAVWIRSRTDPIVRVDEDAASATNGLPVLGHFDADSDPTEGKRALRAKLAAVGPASGVWHTIVVAENVDPTALAVAFAKGAIAPGDRALVIAALTSGPTSSDAGLPELLEYEAGIDNPVDDAADRETGIEIVALHTANPFDAVAEAALHRMIGDLRTRYAVIVIGSASAQLSSAQAAASECADSTVLIAVAGSTRRRELAAVNTGLRTAGTPVAGVVLANSPVTRSESGAETAGLKHDVRSGSGAA